MSLNPANTVISVGASWPPVYVRGQANTAQLLLSGESGAVTASACTYTLLNPSGATVVTGAATCTAGSCTYALTSSHLTSTSTVGGGYTERWSLTISSATRLQEREIIVGIRDLAPPTQLTDLTGRYATLANQLPRNVTSWQTHLAEAWGTLIRRILRDGLLVFRAMTPSALREPHEHLTLARIFADLAVSQPEDSAHARAKVEHQTAYEDTYNGMRTALDQADAGRVDDDARLVAPRPAVVHVNSAPFGFTRWGNI